MILIGLHTFEIWRVSHNLACHLALSMKENKLDSENVEKIPKGIEQEVPTKVIQKLISAESGVKKLTVHDINNLRYKNTDRVNLCKLKNKVFAMRTCSTSERYDFSKRYIDEFFQTPKTFNNAEIQQKFNKCHITSKLRHFGCVTTQRAESRHSIVKRGVFSLQPLDLAFRTIEINLSNFERGYKDIENREKPKVDVRVLLGPRLAHLIGKVTHRGLVSLCTKLWRGPVDIFSP
ncbi:uncharacterized protein EV154DRAFT_488330 [Mucor mucedo]|uniref:uncharacterized protein n=1 Tax=Mucor mucedo TaxID=29922 RepID=UPI002220B442|nr:uncharacterized protein EV154DRAFT_488330 [Mucor mucedo]KAI7867336.1 hypothetical protein EV154DRAFT_488330 [Mucor mucedo]